MPESIISFLKDSVAIPGLPGFEKPSADLVRDWFTRYSQDVWQDAFYNTYARMGGGGPRVMLAAHSDGLGLMVRSVEEDGFLGIVTVGGFDPRVLPGLEVTVHGREGDYYGVIGAKPPHVLNPEERKKVLTTPDLFVDIGYPKEKAEKLVSVGDIVSFHAPLQPLAGDVVTGRALDDRAGVAILLEAMRNLKKTPCEADAVFVATTREEVGSYGARMGAHTLRPDIGIVLDVTHAVIGKGDDPRMVAYDKPCIAMGPRLDRRLRLRLEQVAKKAKIDYEIEVTAKDTSTDGDDIQASLSGVPIVLLELPLRYMHTTVECIHSDLIARTGKLLALFLREINEDWEGWPCI